MRALLVFRVLQATLQQQREKARVKGNVGTTRKIALFKCARHVWKWRPPAAHEKHIGVQHRATKSAAPHFRSLADTTKTMATQHIGPGKSGREDEYQLQLALL